MPRLTTPSPRPAAAAAAGSLALLLTAGLLPAVPAAAAPEDFPVGGWAAACADAEAQYCVESATVTPIGGEPTAAADLDLTASATSVPGESPTFDWAIAGWSGELDDVTGGDVTLVIRTGQYVPRFSAAAAEGMRITRTSDEADNYTMTVTGRPVHVDWTTGEFAESCFALQHCGEDDLMADEAGSGYRFSGNTSDLDGNTEDFIDTIDGAYIATDAQARTGLIAYDTEPEPYLWIGVLGNPHLDIDGKPVRGSFNAWVPGTYFASLEMTVEDAIATGFDLVNGATVDSPVSIPVLANIAADGIDISATGIGYGINYFNVYHRPSGAPEGVTVPGAPYVTGATSEFGEITGEWNPSEYDGGSPITGYNLRAFTEATGGAIAGRCQYLPGDGDDGDHGDDGGDGDDDSDDSDDDDVPSCTIAGLTEGVTYYLAVSAFNALGEGDTDGDRFAIEPGTPSASPPSEPKAVNANPAAARLTVSWSLPDEDNGAPINEYTARAFTSANGQNPVRTCTAVAPARTCALTPLTNGVKYYVGVTATNDAGEGPESARAVGTPRTVPGVPRSIKVSTSKGKIKIAWTAPLSTGGSAVLSYRANVYLGRTGGKSVAHCITKVAVRTCTPSGLKVGRSYYVTVNAKNGVGVSAEPTRIKVVVRK